jgi:hypothetical protein
MMLTERLTIYANVIFVKLILQQFFFYNIFVILLNMFIILLNIHIFINICGAKGRKRLSDKIEELNSNSNITFSTDVFIHDVYLLVFHCL